MGAADTRTLSGSLRWYIHSIFLICLHCLRNFAEYAYIYAKILR